MLTLLIATAHASPPYPGALQTDLAMPCAPPCTVCHDSNLGGAGTVTSAFGAAMQDRGLTGGSATDALSAALDALATDGVDSDGDGVGDVEELGAGDDPNADGPALCGGAALPTAEYGCFNQSQAAAGALAVLLAAVAARRQR